MDSWKLQLWRRLSPGKNPPLMLEHLGFHPTAPPLSLPPSLPCLYISSRHALGLFWSWIIFIPASSACGGPNTVSLSRRRAEPLLPPSPIFTGGAHAPDPAHPRNRPTGRAHLSMQRRTNKPPPTVCSVSHSTSPSISITPLL